MFSYLRTFARFRAFFGQARPMRYLPRYDFCSATTVRLTLSEKRLPWDGEILTFSAALQHVG